MSDEKRPAPANAGPAQDPQETKAPPTDEAESDFFEEQGEHDGWGPIVKRRTPSDPAPE